MCAILFLPFALRFTFSITRPAQLLSRVFCLFYYQHRILDKKKDSTRESFLYMSVQIMLYER